MGNQSDVYYLVSEEEVNSFTKKIIDNFETYGPVKKRDEYSFEQLEKPEDLVIEGYIPTIIPPKKFFLPPTEEIVELDYKTGEAKPIFNAREITLIGVRPCDLKAIEILDTIMADGNPDPNYLYRREKITIIGFDCNSACDEYSLCEVVGALNITGGFDIFFSKYNNDYVMWYGTDKGKKLGEEYIKSKKELSKKEIEEFNLYRNKNIAENFNHKVKYIFHDVSEIFMREYNSEYWEELGKKCLTCGSCNMVCPTCYCFTIEEEVDLKLEKVTRKRIWDGCMLRDFAMVAGGHNFRPTASMRLKHRWNRKFNYLMKKYKVSNCVGCGRCGRACLVNINPIDILNNILGEYYSGVKNESKCK